jgi:hypothetical protein
VWGIEREAIGHGAEVGRNGERYRTEVKKGVNNEIRNTRAVIFRRIS